MGGEEEKCFHFFNIRVPYFCLMLGDIPLVHLGASMSYKNTCTDGYLVPWEEGRGGGGSSLWDTLRHGSSPPLHLPLPLCPLSYETLQK